MNTPGKEGGERRNPQQDVGQGLPDEVLHEVYDLLYDDFCRDLDMEKRMRLNNRLQPVLFLSRSGVKDVWSFNQIRQYCIDNRLIFRPLNSFSGKIPAAILQEVKKLEAKLGKEIGPFWIVAHPHAFRKDIPGLSHELFAQTGRLTFFRIGSWGEPVAPYRPWLFFPLRDAYWLVSTVIVLSFLSVWALSNSVIPQLGTAFGELSAVRFSMQVWVFFVCGALYTWAAIGVFGRTSDKLWKSD